MSSSPHQRASSEHKDRPASGAREPMRLRVPQLSAHERGQVKLVEAEEILPSADLSRPIPMSAVEVPPTGIEKARALRDPFVAVSQETRPAELEPVEEKATSADSPALPRDAATTPAKSERSLRIDAPEPKAAGPHVPPYMAAGRRARWLRAMLWASGGALAAAGIIALTLTFSGAARQGESAGQGESMTPIQWSQNPEAPLRSAAPEPAVAQAPPADAAPVAESVAPAEPVAPQPGVAGDPAPPAKNNESREVDPLDLPLEAPMPTERQQAGSTPPPQVPTLSSEMPTTLHCGPVAIENPYYSPASNPQPEPRTARQIGPASSLPVETPSAQETYPRTSAANWKFSDIQLAEREPLRTSMRPEPAANGATREQPQSAVPDDSQYRLQGTIDSIPLR